MNPPLLPSLDYDPPPGCLCFDEWQGSYAYCWRLRCPLHTGRALWAQIKQDWIDRALALSAALKEARTV